MLGNIDMLNNNNNNINSANMINFFNTFAFIIASSDTQLFCKPSPPRIRSRKHATGMFAPHWGGWRYRSCDYLH